MRFLIFFSGTMVLILGVVAWQFLERNEALAFLQGTLTVGGGMIICGLFALNMKWHGIIGAGVMALLGAARGIGNIPDFIKLLSGNHQRGPAPALEFGVTAICLLLLLRVLGALRQERTRRMLEEE